MHPIEGGRTIPILFIGDSSEEGKSNVMLLGAHHGNEPDSAESVLAFASYILEERNEMDSDILDSVNMIILPVLNPYGLDKGIRTDEDEQDINRDYPFAPSPAASDSDGIPLTTQGARVVHEMAKRYPIEIALSFHTGSWGIFTPWGAQGIGNITPDHSSFMELGKALSKASAQNMPYGPANDYKGISYLTGAYDDHLYGSSIVPEMVFSDEMVLPWSTASLTVELRTGLGKDPEGLGSPADMEDEKPSARTIPTAIRICLASCMIASHGVTADYAGSEVEFRVYGSDQASELEMMEVGAGGTTVGLRPIVEADLLYPMMTLRASPGNDATSVYLSGMVHPEWMDPLEDATPKVSPRSLLSISSVGTISTVLPIRSVDEPQPVRIEPMVLEPSVGSFFNVSVTILTSDRVMDLTIKVSSGGMMEKYLFREDELTSGVNILSVLAPDVEGDGIIIATLRTQSGTYEDSMPFLVHPNFIWSHRFVESGLLLDMHLIGANGSRPVMIQLRPTPERGSTISTETYVESIGPGESIINLNISDLHGNYTVSAWVPPSEIGKEVNIFFRPAFTVSRVPIRIVGGHLIIGPVTAYLGRTPLERTGEFGDNTVKVALYRDIGTEMIELDFLPPDSFSGPDWGLAREQAILAGADPAELKGAFYKDIEHPGPGDYTVGCMLMNDAGKTDAPQDGYDTDRIIYGPFTIKDGKEDFPYPVVIIFVALIVVMMVVSYLRFPARMESIEKKEMERRRNGR
jgi:hypothetical protein